MNIDTFIKFDSLSLARARVAVILHERDLKRHDDLLHGTALSFFLARTMPFKVGHEKEKRFHREIDFFKVHPRCNSSAARHSKNHTYLTKLSNSLLAPPSIHWRKITRVYITLLLSATNFSPFYNPPFNPLVSTLKMVHRLLVYAIDTNFVIQFFNLWWRVHKR